MSLAECMHNYSFRVSEQETIFRDLFGKEELEFARKRYYEKYYRKTTYLEYLIEEIERKLREQDGN